MVKVMEIQVVSHPILLMVQVNCLYLCLLFNLMKFNYIPGDMLLSTVIPIPKNNQCLSSSDNYRGIVLSSIVGKMFDVIILKQNAHICATD